MNQNSPPADGGASSSLPTGGADLTGLLTTVHLIWLAIFAAVVIAAIVYGAHLKRKRRRAERQVSDHAEAAGVTPTTPTAAPPPPAPAPSPPMPASEPMAAASPDDEAANGPVTQLKGLGPKVAARLAELGITTVGQIAALDHDGATRLDAQLGAFAGRMERDRWVEQARFLAAGDRKGFEAVFGRL